LLLAELVTAAERLAAAAQECFPPEFSTN